MTGDLIASLRSLAAAKHDDLSVAADAADEIERLRAENKRLFTRRCEIERLRADRVHRNDLRAEAWEEGWFARDCQKSDWNENPYRGGEGNERHN